MARAEGRRSLVGSCHPLDVPFPLGPVIQGIRDAVDDLTDVRLNPVVGALRPLVPEAAGIMPPALAPLPDPHSERHRVFRAVHDLLGALTPALLILEDVHWADQNTLDLVRFLVRQLPEHLTVVMTSRPEEGGRATGIAGNAGRDVHVARIELDPFSPEEVRELIGSLLDTDSVSGEFASFMHEQTGGIPFAVEEVLGLFRDRRDIVRREGRWVRAVVEDLQVPPTLRDAILARIDATAPDTRGVVIAASIVADPAPEGLLAAMTDLPRPRLAAALAEATGRWLLQERPDGSFAFRNALARQAVYEATPGPERRILHLRAAQELSDLDPPPHASLAHHFREADRPREWIRHAETAADIAASLGDDAGASRLLGEVLSASGLSRDESIRIVTKLGRSALHGLTHTEAIAMLDAAVEEEGLTPDIRGELRLSLAWLRFQAGQTTPAYEQVVKSVSELEGRPGLAARAMGTLALPQVAEHTASEHLEWSAKAVRIGLEHGDEAERASVLADRAATLRFFADPSAREAMAQLPTAPASFAEMQQVVRGHLNFAQASFWCGMYEAAAALVARGLELSEEWNYERQLGSLRTTMVLVDWARGRWEGLDRTALDLVAATADIPHASVDAQLALALMLLARGELREAEQRLSAAIQAAVPTGSVAVAVAAWGGLARISLERGEPENAIRQADEGIEAVRRKAVWVWGADVLPAAVEARLALADVSGAESMVNEVHRGVRGTEARSTPAAVTWCRGLIAQARTRHSDAARYLAAAVRAWEGLPRPYEMARVREALGRSRLAEGRQRRGESLVEALGAFQSLGASWDASRVRATLREAGIILPYRGGRRGYGDRLSPQETAVARLAAGGKTNREIAEAMFLSPRTVANHLGRAMRKLGVRSRYELPEPSAPR